MVRMVLEPNGYSVDEAENGRIGLDFSIQNNYDLILSDINMPVMNGFDFVRNVRTLKDHRFTPILCLTTETSREMRIMGKEVGATGWIVKPFYPDKLMSMIQRVL